MPAKFFIFIPSLRRVLSKRRLKQSLVVLVFAIAGGVVVSGHSWRRPVQATKQPAHVAMPGSITRSAPAQAERLAVERITIRPTGFDPEEITRPPGRFILAVDNRSGLKEVSLRLSNQLGVRIREQRVPREKLGWRNLLELQPGSYVLTEAEHPEWVSRIIVTPQ